MARSVIDASKNFGEPGLQIDVVEFRRLDERIHDHGPVGPVNRRGVRTLIGVVRL
jgi:hypothetical protein